MPFTHRVYFSFFERGDGNGGGIWVVQFSPPTFDRALGRTREVKTEQAIRDMIERTPTTLTLEIRQALDRAFSVGRGGIWLELTDEQYQAVLR